ncbi:response regulator transcription factor [Pseudomonas chlororaphis]|uniref:response regulator transcription factor n=1 Tax=Pseudomonas chlororaphis TaxID=587753 RepID=UPI002367D04A|nr:response regulator transcription factor [Pseudomonas chlororaphis]WDG77622.1 response regulator transcription factor [Pseudomonas chlororaphis]WDG83141.1 response regulator transcription factor [Pseudomonas chlororaphis]
MDSLLDRSGINVIVADDHPVVVLGICKALEDAPDLHLTAAATSITELRLALSQAPCDVLICDYSFENDGQPDGLQLLERIRREYPELKIILLTAYDELLIVQYALRAGINGFLSKNSEEFSKLPNVIRRVLGGEKYLDPSTSSLLIGQLVNGASSSQPLAPATLSMRETEVARLLTKGMSVTEIAQYTNRSIKTISAQKKRVMIKLGANNDIELANALSRVF